MWFFEDEATRSEIDNLWDALFFSTVQLLTDSSQMPKPGHDWRTDRRHSRSGHSYCLLHVLCTRSNRRHRSPQASARPSGCKPGFDLESVGGPRIQIPLPERTVEFEQRLRLSCSLDSFGDDVEVERGREAKDCVDECSVGRIAVDPVDERLRDLQHVDRKVPEVTQRGVPGAEVVERQSEPELAKLRKGLDRRGRVLHRVAFGDLEDHRLR
jgi:hypothetical protein